MISYLQLMRGDYEMHRSLAHLRLVAIAMVVSLAACATKPPVVAAPTTPQPAAKIAENAILPGSIKDFTINVGDTVHFDYDRYDIGDEDRGTLQRQATWLLKYSNVRVTIEGNCDERGTREYNLALGARRAEAVKRYLGGLGVPLERMSTVSYGKERPVCTQSDETCWAQNRRGVTAITGGAATS
jgi:peptidoglycan-associated lipoprotein